MRKTLSFIRHVISWELSDVMATSLFLPIKIYFSLVNQRLLKFPVSIVISKGVNWPWPVFYIYMGLLYLFDGLDLPIWSTRHYSTDSVPSFHLDTITIYLIGTFFFRKSSMLRVTLVHLISKWTPQVKKLTILMS